MPVQFPLNDLEQQSQILTRIGQWTYYPVYLSNGGLVGTRVSGIYTYQTYSWTSNNIRQIAAMQAAFLLDDAVLPATTAKSICGLQLSYSPDMIFAASGSSSVAEGNVITHQNIIQNKPTNIYVDLKGWGFYMQTGQTVYAHVFNVTGASVTIRFYGAILHTWVTAKK